MENLSFFLLLGFLGIVYIGNCHYAEKKARKIQKMDREVQQLNRQHMALVAKVMNETKHASVEEDVKSTGLKPPEGRPYRIVGQHD